MATLGEKIRTLRKEKRLTQTELAGTELTKSMLSQIENGKATPSMKTLHYLADKLDCDASFLLEENDEDLTELVQEMEQYINDGRFEEVYNKLLPIIQNDLPSTLSAARLYKQYAQIAIFAEDYDIQEYIEKAVIIFQKYTLYRESTETKLFFFRVLFVNKKYTECLQLIDSIRKEYAEKQLEIDLIMQIQLFLDEAIVILAFGDYERAEKILLQSLRFSKENQVYYKTDECYRILSYQATLAQNQEKYMHYIKKAEQFAIFTENTFSASILHILKASYHNATKQYDIALQHVELYLEQCEHEIDFKQDGFYYLEKGKALYGLGKYEEALETLQQVEMPRYAFHPLDQAWVITAGSYRALCYMQLQNKEQALNEATQAFDAIQEFPDSMFTTFIEETLQIIQKL
ncbi:helix-turn-helix transcriptional regulator [Bacillus sp. DX1.1]|uniref:helix-turn-helix domain-containing protein n=1 Tax=unclassified Bacillus (in: firmicutes) TaxID=185979 RepID=UPI00257037DF|nr:MULTISPECIES: helix-turn-helix transcriptional regulator [unclassified Bacillus (in: firmicutes)]MDM5154271.1 helix-turn-helix transcriptional regulator [Bacillus sp. DX1.1]WJE83189.1 helix-turn-helix transcriptional regulator [Bacillus sp. DX3.1]